LIRTILTLALLLFLPAVSLAAEAPSNEELARRLDVVLQELEDLKLGAVADSSVARERLGFAPGASRIYGRPPGVSVGGYGEILLRRPDRFREDDAPSGQSPQLDAMRLITYVGYKFDDRLLFNSEIELEHAGVRDEAEVEVDTGTGEGEAELTGEAVVEFAYLDWALRESVGLRAGLLLVPVGWINELHEPPVFFGATRPDVERNLLPTTWSGVGAGAYGSGSNGIEWRLYVIEGLDASHFSASSGFRGGRQSGSQALATHPAITGRLDWTHDSGISAGASFFAGNASQQANAPAADPLVTLWDAHARVRRGGFEARGLFASSRLTHAAELSDALGLTAADRLGERGFGGYAEFAFDLLALARPGGRQSVAPFVRYEVYDTQESVPGGSESAANERRIVTAGASLKPHPQVVLKIDRQLRHDGADTETGVWNAALGWLF
jgi:hypothetical protein